MWEIEVALFKLAEADDEVEMVVEEDDEEVEVEEVEAEVETEKETVGSTGNEGESEGEGVSLEFDSSITLIFPPTTGMFFKDSSCLRSERSWEDSKELL